MKPKLSVLFEDDALLAVNKPVGLVVNDSSTAPAETLQGILSDLVDVPDDGSEFSSRGGVVHRLDKDTSGIILISKNSTAFEALKAQFKQRTVEKHYYAVVVGTVNDALLEINAPIKRNPQNRMRFAIVEGGKEALTTATRIKILDGFTSMDVTPKTGRTHQIRVHFAAMGYPIAGDPLYCTRSIYSSSIDYFGRMMLHAYSLKFQHPITEEPMNLVCDPEEDIWKLFIPRK